MNELANLAKENSGGGRKNMGKGDGGQYQGYDNGGVDRVAEAILSLTKQEMYTILSEFKMLASKNMDEARALLTSHPQLPEAILHIMSKMEMIKTPLPQLLSIAQSMANPGMGAAAPIHPPPPTQSMQPPIMPPGGPPMFAPPPTFAPPPAFPGGSAAAPPQPAATSDPRRRDPRLAASAPPPAAAAAPPAYPSIPGISQELIHQVMSLTDEQIQQLPQDQQGSILTLRQQVMAHVGR